LDSVVYVAAEGANALVVFVDDRVVPGVAADMPQTLAMKLLNYPNPFNPSTRIFCEFPSDESNCTLNIYNVKGQLVKNLWAGIAKGRSITIDWDGRNNAGIPVSSGTYFCVLRYGSEVVSRKINLLK
jgi:hypothetical protein